MDETILKCVEDRVIEELKAKSLTYSDAEKVLDAVHMQLGNLAKL